MVKHKEPDFGHNKHYKPKRKNWITKTLVEERRKLTTKTSDLTETRQEVAIIKRWIKFLPGRDKITT